jgi:predicted NACHT family NTPase
MSMQDFWQNLTKERPAAIIQGYPGVGKSTLLKYLALYMARRCLKQRSRAVLAPLTPALTPFLISLGDFANERSRTSGLSLLEYVQLKLSRLHIPGLVFFLEERLDAGQCLMLLDGLDEISDHRMRIEIQREIKEFILTCSDLFDTSSHLTRFLVTTRVAGYDQAAFPTCPHYTIAELTPEQIDTFLPRWCRAILRLDPAFAQAAENEAARFEREVQQRTEELRTSIYQRPELHTLVENPFCLPC